MLKILFLVIAAVATVLLAQENDIPTEADVITENQLLDWIFPNLTDLKSPRSGITLFGNKLYSVVPTKVNWYTAIQVCSSQGLNLASISSETEHNSLQSYLNDIGFGTLSADYWISGVNLGNTQTYTWLSNGRPLTFQNWDSNEPNNSGGNEHCIALRSNGKWNDANCEDALKYFICENRCSLDSYSVPLYK